MRYSNLVGEMARRKVTNKAMADLLGVHSNSIYNKLNGDSSFSVNEAIQVRDAFFSGLSIEKLFARDEDATAEENGGERDG